MKTLTLILSILALLGAAASAFFYVQIGDTKTKLQGDLTASTSKAESLEQELDKTKGDLKRTADRLTETDNELATAKSRISTAEARATTANREVNELKSQLQAKTQAEQTLNSEIANLRRDLVQTRLATTQGAPEEVEGYRTTIANLERRLRELGAANGTAAATTEGTDTASGDQPATTTDLAATVVRVGPQNSFVVFDVGTAQGASTGQSFSITRGDQEVARAIISDVRENHAVAQVAPASIKSALRAGDAAAVVAN